jgi:hypothetical protein
MAMNGKMVHEFDRIKKEMALDQSRYYPDILLGGTMKKHNISLNTTPDFSAQIRTEGFPNKSLDRYRYATPFVHSFFNYASR